MPRTSQGPRYYKSKRGWFANFNGERVRLTTGPKKETQEEAKERYEAEMQARKVETQGDRNTVWAVLNAYLADCENRVKNGDMAESTCRMHRHVIVPFNKKHGLTAVRDLRPQHVTDFLAEMRQPRWHEKLKREVVWKDGTVKLARNVLRTAFRWGVEEAGLITKSPFERAGRGQRPKRQRRRPTSSRTAISDAEHDLLFEQAVRRTKKDFANLLLFLRGTGARPAEIYLATAAEWDEAKRAFVVKATPENRGRYKLAHLGEHRTVYVPASLVPLAKELMAKYPTGPIFRTESGEPWTNATLCARFTSIKKAANRAAERKGVSPVRKAVTAYAYRHRFVTAWVEEGRHLWKLCELLNTSEAMIRQHYSWLFERTESLLESLDDFTQGREARPSTPTDPEKLPAASLVP
jgi:integrase